MVQRMAMIISHSKIIRVFRVHERENIVERS
jgi:hypothetical protein